jgi:hypothetical protein
MAKRKANNSTSQNKNVKKSSSISSNGNNNTNNIINNMIDTHRPHQTTSQLPSLNIAPDVYEVFIFFLLIKNGN